MATPTYTALATTTLSSAVSSVTFSSIPATYRDLIVVINAGVASPTPNVNLYYNADTTGANYTNVWMQGSSAGANSSTGLVGIGNIATDGIFILQIMDYSATDKHKTTLGRWQRGATNVFAAAYRWADTAAINSIEYELSGSSFVAGSTFSLYGIEA